MQQFRSDQTQMRSVFILMHLMETIQLEEDCREGKKGKGKKKKDIKGISHITASSWNTNLVHDLFLQQETAFMYSRFIITRSRCNLTTKLSEALRIKTQAVTNKANTFFVQRAPLKAYSVNSVEILQSKNEKILECTQIYSLQLSAQDWDSKGYEVNIFAS